MYILHVNHWRSTGKLLKIAIELFLCSAVERSERTPEFDNLSIVVPPQVTEAELVGEPIEAVTFLSDEGKHLFVRVLGHIQLRVVSNRRVVGSH